MIRQSGGGEPPPNRYGFLVTQRPCLGFPSPLLPHRARQRGGGLVNLFRGCR